MENRSQERIKANSRQDKKASCVATFRFNLKIKKWKRDFPTEEEANYVFVMKRVFWGVLCEYSLWCFL